MAALEVSGTCERCGRDVRIAYAGSVQVLRHAIAPVDPHYPRLSPSRSGPEMATPLAAATNASVAPLGRSRPVQPDDSRSDGTPAS